MVSGAIYFLQGVFGGNGKKSTDGLKKKIVKEKPEVVPAKKEKSRKEQKIIPLKDIHNPERKKALEDLKGNFQKAYRASSKLKKIAKEGGSDIERCQIQAIHSQMKLVAKLLENLKK
jgi:lantibiotic modifying enzyme